MPTLKTREIYQVADNVETNTSSPKKSSKISKCRHCGGSGVG
jgi:hypothetical protein